MPDRGVFRLALTGKFRHGERFPMDYWHLIILGLAAGVVAAFIIPGKGVGLLGNLVVGILGAFLGRWIFGELGITLSSQGMEFVSAVTGAALLLLLLGILRR